MVDPPLRRPPRVAFAAPTPRRAGVAGLCVIASLAASLTACGGDAATRPGSAATSGRTSPAPERASGGDRSAAWPGGTDDREVVARRKVSVRRALDARTSTHPTADLLVRGLTVRGRVATLRFTAVLHGWDYEEPKAPSGEPPAVPTLFDINPGWNTDIVTAQLIDPVHLRRHRPLEDSEGEVLASMNFVGQSGEGQAMDASWMFAAPPDDVDAMDVQVGSWPVFREVQVTRR